MEHVGVVDDELLGRITRALCANEPLRFDIPGGRVHIDRQLPFLLVYRRPPDRDDPGTADLILGEAAYLLAPGEDSMKAAVSEVVATVADAQAAEFGAVLILELWSSTSRRGHGQDMVFQIHAPAHHAPASVLEEFETALLGVEVAEMIPLVEVVYDDAWCPPGLAPLAVSGESPVLHLGLEVPAVHFDAETGAVHPFELMALRRSLSRAIRRAVHEFSHAFTTSSPAHFHQLGRQAMTDAVREADWTLADLSDDFDLLLHVTPVNAHDAQMEFIESGFQNPPEFLYRPRTVDPSTMKRRLFSVPIERIEDPTLAHIFHEKREELDRQLNLIADRNTPRFLLGSRALYDDAETNLHQLALELLSSIDAESEDEEDTTSNAQLLAELASQELSFYIQQDPSLLSAVALRDDIPGVMVSEGNLLIGRRASISKSRMAPLIAHEIGTHILTHHNGRQQPFRELYAGMAGYESLQEGLAVFSEYLVGGLSGNRIRQLAGRVVAVQCLVDGADFVETFAELTTEWGFSAPQAFDIAMRAFRSGGFTKDVVYLRGLTQVLEYLAAGEPIERLFLGKIAHPYLDLIQELEWRNVLLAPRLLPRFLSWADVRERIGQCQAGLTVSQLLQETTR